VAQLNLLFGAMNGIIAAAASGVPTRFSFSQFNELLIADEMLAYDAAFADGYGRDIQQLNCGTNLYGKETRHAGICNSRDYILLTAGAT
jgi:hypothetical protein